MSETTVVAGLALRELWISFRLLALIGVLAAAGLVAVAVPVIEPIAQPLPWLAGALAAGACFVAALAAWSFGQERRRGAAAWLVSRSVSRGAVLGGWLAALVALLVVSIVPVGVLGWLTVVSGPLAGAFDAGGYVAALAATFADLLAALCLGLFIGTLLPRRAATLAALLAVAAVVIIVLSGITADEPFPGAGLRLLGELPRHARPVADALRAAGTSLIAAALLIAAARVAVERSEL